MKFISTVTRTVYLVSGKVLNLVTGQPITKGQKNLLDSMNRSSYYEVRMPGKRGKYHFYDTDKRYFIAEAYVAGYTRNEIVEDFQQEFGKDHPVSSIGEKVEICKATDNQLPNHTQFVCNDKELISILQGMNSVRFGSDLDNKIDTILEQIRS